MQKSNMVLALLGDNVKAVEVTFPTSGGKYTYMTTLDLAVGDKVVVDTPRAGLQVVEVINADAEWDIDAKFVYKFIVSKVDTSYHEDLQVKINEVKEIVEQNRRDQARKAIVESLNLKAAQVKAITNIGKGLPRL